MADLKPCPFCGGEAKMRSFPYNHLVYCSACEASTRKFFPTKEETIEAWNRRTDAAPTITPESLVRHGRWETSSDPEEIIKDFACSICDEVLCDFDTEVCWPGQNCYFFCPNCGALMREDKPC